MIASYLVVFSIFDKFQHCHFLSVRKVSKRKVRAKQHVFHFTDLWLVSDTVFTMFHSLLLLLILINPKYSRHQLLFNSPYTTSQLRITFRTFGDVNDNHICRYISATQFSEICAYSFSGLPCVSSDCFVFQPSKQISLNRFSKANHMKDWRTNEFTVIEQNSFHIRTHYTKHWSSQVRLYETEHRNISLR